MSPASASAAGATSMAAAQWRRSPPASSRPPTRALSARRRTWSSRRPCAERTLCSRPPSSSSYRRAPSARPGSASAVCADQCRITEDASAALLRLGLMSAVLFAGDHKLTAVCDRSRPAEPDVRRLVRGRAARPPQLVVVVRHRHGVPPEDCGCHPGFPPGVCRPGPAPRAPMSRCRTTAHRHDPFEAAQVLLSSC